MVGTPTRIIFASSRDLGLIIATSAERFCRSHAEFSQCSRRHERCYRAASPLLEWKAHSDPADAPYFMLMNNTGVLERADKLLHLRWRESLAPWPAQTTRPFITLSRQSGSGGTSLARLLTRQLNATSERDVCWQVFEGNLAGTMLKEHHLPTRIARFLPEDRVSELNASVGELVGLHPSLWELRQKMNATLQGLARNGHAILVGRGSNFATRGIPGGLHVRLVAPPAYRALYAARTYGVSESTAIAFNAKRDAARRRYVRDTFSADIDDASAYDLTINTASMSLAEAAKLVSTHLQAKLAAR